MRNVEVVAYRQEWPDLFQVEERLIRLIMPGEVEEIYHIGSTSVPGLSAKPVIDILVVVGRIEAVDDYDDKWRENGYEVCGEYGIEGRRFFRKGGDDRTHHVHVFETGHPDVFRHLAFRNYLREFPFVRTSYATLKQQLAAAHPTDIEAYIAGKADWIRRVEREACLYYGEGERACDTLSPDVDA